MSLDWTGYLFYANLAAQGALLVGAVWCIALPRHRIYPMKTKGFWFYAMWLLFYFVFFSNGSLVLLDWNRGLWASGLRFVVGVPILALGASLFLWGFVTLGAKNTSGLRDGFVARGAYLITRNPQYVGDISMFLGFTIIANSELVLVTHLLTSLLFVLAPLAEEPWLQSQYGDAYAAYRREVPRFL